MPKLQQMVFAATLEPERFKFYKLTKGPDGSIRYLYLHTPSEGLTKQVAFIIEAGEVSCNSLTTDERVYLTGWESVQKQIEDVGYESMYLKHFAAELTAICQVLEEDID